MLETKDGGAWLLYQVVSDAQGRAKFERLIGEGLLRGSSFFLLDCGGSTLGDDSLLTCQSQLILRLQFASDGALIRQTKPLNGTIYSDGRGGEFFTWGLRSAWKEKLSGETASVRLKTFTGSSL